VVDISRLAAFRFYYHALMDASGLFAIGMEFFDVHFSYLDNQTLEEFFVNVSEALFPKSASSHDFPCPW
jgi:hypothetical protein